MANPLNREECLALIVDFLVRIDAHESDYVTVDPFTQQRRFMLDTQRDALRRMQRGLQDGLLAPEHAYPQLDIIQLLIRTKQRQASLVREQVERLQAAHAGLPSEVGAMVAEVFGMRTFYFGLLLEVTSGDTTDREILVDAIQVASAICERALDGEPVSSGEIEVRFNAMVEAGYSLPDPDDSRANDPEIEATIALETFRSSINQHLTVFEKFVRLTDKRAATPALHARCMALLYEGRELALQLSQANSEQLRDFYGRMKTAMRDVVAIVSSLPSAQGEHVRQSEEEQL